MLKHIVHSYHGKLHTFDDFYRDDSNSIKARSSSNDLVSTNHCSSSSPTSPCSPNSNPYTFYNIFSDFKYSTTPDVVPEEDETEDDNEIHEQESSSATAVFYLEDDHNTHSQISPPSSSSNWSSLIINRFRHANTNNNDSNNNNNSIIKQILINESQMSLPKLRKNDFLDSSASKHRYLKRSETINHTNDLREKTKYSNDELPESTFSATNNVVKKHRSFVSLFTYFHHNHHQNLPTKSGRKSNSINTLHFETLNLNNTEFSRPKFIKQKTLPSSSEICSPVTKSPPKPILPKLASLFHRNHTSEQHKSRIKNLKTRLHHRRNSPPLSNTTSKFQYQVSNELIHKIKQLEGQPCQDNDHLPCQRIIKPVVMKRVRTWHNAFDMRPVDQCLEY